MAFDRARFESAAYEFFGGVRIISKDEGERPLLPLMGSQKYAFDRFLDGLERGVRWFIVDKARQQGSTTLWLAIGLLWGGLYPGLRGGIVADTEANKEETVRGRLDEMIDRLPDDFSMPVQRGRAGHNKLGVHFENGSVLQYLVAGTKKGTGSLGRSRSLNFLLATEAAFYGDDDQIENLKAALSETYPDRLYIFESTPNGYNHFYDMWQDAQADDLTMCAIFVGWWQNEKYCYEEGSDLFERYGANVLSPYEREVAAEVLRRYGFAISRGQWAWYRHNSNPQGGTEVLLERAESFLRMYPSTPEEGFRSSGTPFMRADVLGKLENEAARRLLKPFSYEVAEDWRAMRFDSGRRGRVYDLKVWEEPVAGGSYIVSGDPAFASSEGADAYVAEVLRCYADRVEQVAEFHRKSIAPYQFTWILAHLCGWYRNVRLILEINGPGEAVMTEFRNLRSLLGSGSLELPDLPPGPEMDRRKASMDFLARVKTYLYHRPDSLGSGYAYQWKTTPSNRTPILVGLADQISIGQCVLYSVPALEELRRLRQKGGVIEPEGRAKDDRAMALALGLRCWQDWERAVMRASGRTYERERARGEGVPSGPDPVNVLVNYHMNRDREKRSAALRRQGRLGRRGGSNWKL